MKRSKMEQRISEFGKQVQKATSMWRKYEILDEINNALEAISKKYEVFIELTGEIKIHEKNRRTP